MRKSLQIFGLLFVALLSVNVLPAPSTCLADDKEAGDAGIEIGSYIFGAVRARSIGPAIMSGRVSAVDAVVADPNIVYVGAAGGGVWKSKNGGVNFSAVFDDHPQCIGAITIDQAHPDTVWVGTGEVWVRNSVSIGTGLYKTIDGGENWKCVGLEDSERIAKIIVHPENPDIVWVAAMGHLWDANEQRGVFKTTDGGQTWNKVLYINDSTGCSDLTCEPGQPDMLYAAMWQFRRSADFFTSGGPGSGLHKSTDGGETWTQLSDGLPEGELGRIAVAVPPAEPGRIYAAVESEDTAFYRSDDRGASWRRVGKSAAVTGRPFYFALLIPDPQDPDRLYKTSTALWVTRDGGESFGGVGGNVHADHHAMWINPNNPKHIYVGTDGGAYVTHNRGNGWVHCMTLPISQFYHVSADDKEPYNVFGGLQDNGSWMAPSRSPSGIQSRDWRELGGGDGFAVQPDRSDPDVVYWEYQGGNVTRLHLSTGESKDIIPQPAADEPRYRFNWNTPIVTSPTDPKRLYVGTQFLHRSLDQGESWERISDDLTTDDKNKQRQTESGGLTIDNTRAENHCTIFTIAESPLDKQVIWVGTDDGNLQVTENDGTKWRRVNGKVKGVPKSTGVACVEPSQHNRKTAFVCFDGHYRGDMRAHVYRTDDLGQKWHSIVTDDIEGFARVIRQDPVNPDLLYLGTELGLYITLDGGLHWARFEENLPPVAVHDLAIQHREAALVIGTHGRGIYIIDDLALLRQLTPEAMAADVYLLESKPSLLRIPQFDAGPSGDNRFVGRNPRQAGKIVYYLKKRHMFGKLQIEIFNPDGELVKTIPGGKRKGINMVNWSMRLKPPKVAPSPTFDPMTAFAGLFGPMAPEGNYTYQITKGKQTYDGTLSLVNDPSSPHSAADRELQQKTLHQLYGLQARLTYLAEAMAEARDDTRERADQLPEKEKLARQLREFADEIDRMIGSIMVTREIQGIAGGSKLREDVVRLYGGVASYGGRPTQSQLDRLVFFEKEVDEVNARFLPQIEKKLTELNEKLTAQQLEPVTLLTEEEFIARDE